MIWIVCAIVSGALVGVSGVWLAILKLQQWGHDFVVGASVMGTLHGGGYLKVDVEALKSFDHEKNARRQRICFLVLLVSVLVTMSSLLAWWLL